MSPAFRAKDAATARAMYHAACDMLRECCPKAADVAEEAEPDVCLATVFSTLWLPGSDNLAKEPPMPQISAFPSIKALSILLLVPLNSTSLPWWTTLSIIAEASLSSPRIVPHLLNSMLVVNTTLRFS